MGLPLLDSSLFDFISFRAIEAFSALSYLYIASVSLRSMPPRYGSFSSAGGFLLGACYPRKAAALALDPPKHLFI